MWIFECWWFYIIVYLISAVAFTQSFKVTTKSSKSDGALTILLEILTMIVMLLFIPCFEIKWAADPKLYLFTGLAIIFYCLKDRTATTVRRNLEASTMNILEQMVNVFVILWGILFFNEPVLMKKIIGVILILGSNALLFYQKGKWQWNKSAWLGVFSNLCFSIALSLNVGISDQFNLAIYECFTLIIPAILIAIFEKIRVKSVIKEFKEGNKKAILLTAVMWTISILSQLRAFQLGSITTVAGLCAVSVILNVVISYFLLKEKENLPKKLALARVHYIRHFSN